MSTSLSTVLLLTEIVNLDNRVLEKLNVGEILTKYDSNGPDGLVDVVGRVSGESVVEVPDEVVLVLVLERHEGAAHHDELHLVHRVAQLPELVHAILRLQVRVVSAIANRGGNRTLEKDL